MSAFMNLHTIAQAYDDGEAGTDRLPFGWDRCMSKLSVNFPQSPAQPVPPGGSWTVFSGVRATSTDGTTQFTLTLSPLAGGNRYRLTWTGGTNPVLRTDRGLALSGHTFTFAGNANATFAVTASTVGDFAAVQVGDWLFFPGVSTGDAATNVLDTNAGVWIVLAKDGTSTTLQVTRLPTDTFQGQAQAAVMASNSDVLAFSAAGVQYVDSLDLSAGFATAALGTYLVDRVTSKWVEFLATGPLPVAQVGTPGASGLVFYSAAKRFVRVEVDQRAAVQVNGDATTLHRVQPWQPGNADYAGAWETTGPVWSLAVVNLSAAPLSARAFTAE